MGDLQGGHLLIGGVIFNPLFRRLLAIKKQKIDATRFSEGEVIQSKLSVGRRWSFLNTHPRKMRTNVEAPLPPPTQCGEGIGRDLESPLCGDTACVCSLVGYKWDILSSRLEKRKTGRREEGKGGEG